MLAETRSIKKLTLQFPGLPRSVGVVAAYAAWISVVKFLSLTFVSYFILSSATGEGSRFEEINEAMSSSEIAIFAISALGFIILGRVFTIRPQTPTRPFDEPHVDSALIRKQFIPSFMHGAVLGVGIALAFLISGVYRYVGFFVQVDNTALSLVSIVLRVASITVMVYCEEWIFRKRILGEIIRKRLEQIYQQDKPKQIGRFWHDSAAIAFTSVLYVGIKYLQFDLSWMQAVSIFLISCSLGYRSLPLRATKNGNEHSFVLAAGYWAALLIIFQPTLSLPVFGHEFSGLLMIRYQAAVAGMSSGLLQSESNYSDTIRFLTGGAGGPLASFAFQILIALEVSRAALRYLRKNG